MELYNNIITEVHLKPSDFIPFPRSLNALLLREYLRSRRGISYF